MKQYTTYKANENKVFCYKCDNFIERKMWGDFYYEIWNEYGLFHRFGCHGLVSDGWDDIFGFIDWCLWEYNNSIRVFQDKLDFFYKNMDKNFHKDYFLSLLHFANGCGISAIHVPIMCDKTSIFRLTKGIRFRKGLYSSQSIQSKIENDCTKLDLSDYCFPYYSLYPPSNIAVIQKVNYMERLYPEEVAQMEVVGTTPLGTRTITEKYDFFDDCMGYFLLFCGRYFSTIKRPFQNIPLLFNKTIIENCWFPYYKFDLKTIDGEIFNIIEGLKKPCK